MLDEPMRPASSPAAAIAGPAGAAAAALPQAEGGKRKRAAADADDGDEAGPLSGVKRPALADAIGAVLAEPDDDDVILLE